MRHWSLLAILIVSRQRVTAVRVASISFTPTKWQKGLNWEAIEAKVTEAAAQGAELILTPEGALDGYVINEVNAEADPTKHRELVAQFVSLAEPLDGDYIPRAAALAAQLKIHLLLGFLQRNGSLVHNAAALFDDTGRIALLYHKTHFAQGYEVNPSCYTPGSAFPVANTTLGKIGVMICFDRQLPEVCRALRLNGAELVLVPAYGAHSDANTSHDGFNTRLLQTRAYENQVPLVFTNPAQTLILDNRGDFIAVGPANATTYGTVSVATSGTETLQNRRPPLYAQLNVGADPAQTDHPYTC